LLHSYYTSAPIVTQLLHQCSYCYTTTQCSYCYTYAPSPCFFILFINMGIFELVHFNKIKYAEEIHTLSIAQLQEMAHKLYTSISTSATVFGGGIGLAYFTAGVSLVGSAISGRSGYVTYEKLKIIEKELSSRGVDMPVITTEDQQKGNQKGYMGIAVGMTGTGGSVGSAVSEGASSLLHEVLNEAATDLATDSMQEGVDKVFEHFGERKKSDNRSAGSQCSTHKVKWHEHPLEYLKVAPYEGQQYFCDICGHTRDTECYHCDLCKYDNCPTCFEAALKNPTNPSSKRKWHEHPLVFREKYHRIFPHSCNACKAKIKTGFRCDACDFDNCFECYMAAVISNKRCSISAHPHCLFEVSSALAECLVSQKMVESAFCDLCQDKSVLKSGCYVCFQDGYCVCKKCFQKY